MQDIKNKIKPKKSQIKKYSNDKASSLKYNMHHKMLPA